MILISEKHGAIQCLRRKTIRLINFDKLFGMQNVEHNLFAQTS